MLIASLVIIIGFVALLSGAWEQNMVTIFTGIVLVIAGWISFYLSWRKAAKEGRINKDEQ
ncbi:hypothetical protein [Pseudidiomarina sp.]|uniref:hypothetical protein n=1 Tax=Pseudidiomarina sp. TaxID=2081707 RepID=UPI00299E7B71|nr:hypothetical protein [Pseudidiomarina sp.]MDX1705686.1 hypothetical protein [Pseudidiomarina sp.]